MFKWSSRKIIAYFVLTTAILPFLVLVVFLILKKQQVTKGLNNSYLEEKRMAFNQSLESAGEQLKSTAYLLSQTEEVKRYFYLYENDSLNFNGEMEKIFERYTFSDENAPMAGLHLQMFIPPAKNIFKSWGSNTGEDVSILRKSIGKVNAFQNPTFAFELGRSGLRLRGLAPVYSLYDNYFVGTVEVFSALNTILKQFSKDTELWAVYVKDKNYRLIQPFDRKNSADFHRIGRYVFLTGESRSFESELFDESDFDALEADSNGRFFYRGGKWNFCFPINDYSGTRIAVVAFQTEHTIVDKSVPEFIALGLIMSLLFLFVLSSLAIRWLTHPVLISGLESHLPRFFLFFKEVRALISEQRRKQYDFTKLAIVLKDYFFDRKIGTLAVTNPLYALWKQIGVVINKEQKEIEFLQSNISQKDWLTTASRELDLVLHKDFVNLTDLAKEVLGLYVAKTEANAAVFYSANEQADEITKVAAYVEVMADSEKRSFRFGEGLVGNCAKEKKRVLVKEVPKDYFLILSGLGNAIPNQILLEPLISRGKILGVIELAIWGEFKTMASDFVANSAEQLAVRLNIFNNTQESKHLFQLAESKNERLTELQLDLQKQIDSNGLIKRELSSIRSQFEVLDTVLWNTLLYMELDALGNIITVNDLWVDLLRVPKSHVLSTKFYDGIEFDKIEYNSLLTFWDSLQDGELRKRQFKYVFRDNEFVLNETFKAIIVDQKVVKVIRLAIRLY